MNTESPSKPPTIPPNKAPIKFMRGTVPFPLLMSSWHKGWMACTEPRFIGSLMRWGVRIHVGHGECIEVLAANVRETPAVNALADLA